MGLLQSAAKADVGSSYDPVLRRAEYCANFSVAYSTALWCLSIALPNGQFDLHEIVIIIINSTRLDLDLYKTYNLKFSKVSKDKGVADGH